MYQIPMVDLVNQYKPLAETIQSRFQEICESSAFIGGQYVQSFSHDVAEYLGVDHFIPCANGTDALQLALMALDLSPGDEIITTAFTFVATAEVIALLHLTPRFVDIDPDTFLIDPHQIESCINDRTRAIIPVHLFGQAADMSSIQSIADRHNLYIIEDNAQAIGCHYSHNGLTGYTGGLGDMGTFSFFPSKNLGCYGDGGGICTNDEQLAAKLHMLANHGSTIRYHHDSIGVNSRLDNMQAAVLSAKLPHLDSYNIRRQQAASWYNEGLVDVEDVLTPKEDGHSRHTYHQYTIRTKRRDQLHKHLLDMGIANAIYYPIPLHQQKGYQTDQMAGLSLPATERACREVLSLPMHSELTYETVQIICQEIRRFYD